MSGTEDMHGRGGTPDGNQPGTPSSLPTAPPLLGPGFLDEQGLIGRGGAGVTSAVAAHPGVPWRDGLDGTAGTRRDADVRVAATSAASAAPPLLGPMLLEPEPDATARVDVGWAPGKATTPRPRIGTASSVAAGLAVLLLSWAVLSLASFVVGLLAQSLVLGLLSLAAVALGVALLGRGAVLELRAWRSLARVEQLRAVLATDNTPVAVAREAALVWLERVGGALPERGKAERILRDAASVAEVRAVLRSQVADRLQEAAGRLGRRAAVDGAALVAICPSNAWDGVLAGGRGLIVVRQVAVLYGLRPGVAVTVALMRRVAWTAASTAGIDLLSQSVANQLLDSMPVLKHVAKAAPGMSTAAIRLYNLAGITAKACSPVE